MDWWISLDGTVFESVVNLCNLLQDLTALAKELRELRQGEETSRPPVKVTDYSSSSEDSHSSEDEEGEGGANDGTVAVSDAPRIMWVTVEIFFYFCSSKIRIKIKEVVKSVAGRQQVKVQMSLWMWWEDTTTAMRTLMETAPGTVLLWCVR